MRVLLTFVAVLLAQVVSACLMGWFARRRSPRSWLHVMCVANTLLFFSLMSTIAQFRDEGLTAYGLYYTLLMFWLAYSAAKHGTIGMQMAQRREARPEPDFVAELTAFSSSSSGRASRQRPDHP